MTTPMLISALTKANVTVDKALYDLAFQIDNNNYVSAAFETGRIQELGKQIEQLSRFLSDLLWNENERKEITTLEE